MNSKKYVCEEHIESDCYKILIDEKGSKTTCSYCQQNNICINLNLLVDALNKEFRNDYKIVSSILTDNSIFKIINESYLHNISEYLANDLSLILITNFNIDGFYSRNYYYDLINKERHSELWEYFCKKIKNTTRFFNNHLIESLNELFNEINTLGLVDNFPNSQLVTRNS